MTIIDLRSDTVTQPTPQMRRAMAMASARGPGALTRMRVDQALKAEGVRFDVTLAMDDSESIKRYVEIGMGVAVSNDFTLHPDDHHRFGVVRLDHIFESSVIGVCTLKGKFLGQAVRNFIEVLSGEMRGFHADLTGWDHPETGRKHEAKSL